MNKYEALCMLERAWELEDRVNKALWRHWYIGSDHMFLLSFRIYTEKDKPSHMSLGGRSFSTNKDAEKSSRTLEIEAFLKRCRELWEKNELDDLPPAVNREEFENGAWKKIMDKWSFVMRPGGAK